MKRLHQPWLWCVLIGLIIVSLIVAAYRSNWPGTGFQGKTVWDWLSLLIIPLALALVALFFNQMNTRTEQKIAAQRYEQDKKIALDKQHEDLLQAYLDRMSELLLEKGLRNSNPDDEVRKVARTRTISVLRLLDVKRVGDVFTFLREAGLTDESDPIVSLKDAFLTQVNWRRATLFRVNLYKAILYKADLSSVVLHQSDLSRTYLYKANLSRAKLSNTNLSGANLTEANLNGANLSDTNLSGANLTEANLNGANLSKANLKDAKIDKSQLTPEQIAQAIWD